MVLMLQYFTPEGVVKYHKDIFDILCESNNDFYPKLTERFGYEETPITYFEGIKNNHFIIARDGDKVLGFCSFAPNRTLEINGVEVTGTYINVTCIRRDYRGKGLANLLYEFVDNDLPEHLRSNLHIRRTWGTNYVQLHLYEKHGYELLDIIPNDRRNNVDTLYYIKNMR